MKKFLAVYTASASGPHSAKWKALDDKARHEKENAGKSAWMKWGITNSSSIVDQGSPLGKTKKVNTDGISDIKNNITAYTIVEAESHEAAAEIFLNHPHFTIFPGDSIEIMECLPMPEM